ncbi:MAG: c-type cytochrome [Pontibacterium sp.]
MESPIDLQRKTLIPVFSGLLLLTGCGGGGNSTSATGNDNDNSTVAGVTSERVEITGTVPGTLIEALCDNGSYYQTSSEKNGSSRHPFTLSLPANLSCRLIMTTNETDPDPLNHIITPIVLNNGTSSSTTFNSSASFDLGYVALETQNTFGVQAPLTHRLSSIGFKLIDSSFDPIDSDNNQIPDWYEDHDGDGLISKYDTDEGLDDDADHDGIINRYDQDDDNDGLPDSEDHDDDNDGISDADDADSDQNIYATTTPITPVSAYQIKTGQLLGAQCAQCHGTNGVSVSGFDSLNGSNEITEEMLQIQRGDEAPIMQAQAHGYTLAEITAMNQFFSSLSRSAGSDNDDQDDD